VEGEMPIDNPYYNDRDIEDRFTLILDMFDEFVKVYSAQVGISWKIDLDPYAVYQAVTSYFHDVARYQWWHFKWWDSTNLNGQLLDDQKQFAFTLYWLMKCRPVFISDDASAVVARLKSSSATFDNDPALLANAQFALVASQSFLSFRIRNKLLEELMYHITYRSPSPSDLMLYADALAKIISTNQNVNNAILSKQKI
jgi:hypothetical protein